jgi:CMP-N,N'-diacetyllegionaminic acid synthase
VRVLGLIPARGGSKGIPRKNLAPVAGKPLLAWTIEAALGASSLAAVAVSTEDAEIAAVARALGADVLERPASLAADDTPMLEVVVHALDELPGYDAVCLLQPTSPLRRSTHVDEAVRLFGEAQVDAVVSVTETPHQFLPDSLMRLEAGRLVALRPGSPTLRQDKAVLYARNGPAILVARVAGLAGRGLYGGVVAPYVMELLESLDVDDAADLTLVRLLLER